VYYLMIHKKTNFCRRLRSKQKEKKSLSMIFLIFRWNFRSKRYTVPKSKKNYQL